MAYFILSPKSFATIIPLTFPFFYKILFNPADISGDLTESG